MVRRDRQRTRSPDTGEGVREIKYGAQLTVRESQAGVFNLQVLQPVLFINRLVGTQGVYTTEEIKEYLNRVIVFRFWTPAFKIRPDDFLFFSRDMTLSQPPKEYVAELPQGEVLPVTMPLQDAVESLKINLASFIKPPKMLQVLDTVEIKAKSVVLVYILFQ